MNRVAIGVVFMVASLSGCAGQARSIQHGPDAGVIAIPENSNVWPTKYRDAAEALMKQHLGPNYMIVDEREVVTGGNNTAGPTANTPPAAKEYRITYQRKPAPIGGQLGSSIPTGVGARPTQLPLGAGLGAGPQPAGGYMPGGMTSPSTSSTGLMNSGTIPGVGPGPVGTYPATNSYPVSAPSGRPSGQ